jgi:hypothetical protein
MERVFVRSERPAGWLTMKVTDRTTLGFHERACAARYVESKLDDGLDKADPTIEAAEADMYGANA